MYIIDVNNINMFCKLIDVFIYCALKNIYINDKTLKRFFRTNIFLLTIEKNHKQIHNPVSSNLSLDFI
jgi:hypothetical protein